jgi:nitroreductase
MPGIVRAWGKGKDIVLRGAPNLLVAHSPAQGVTPGIDAVIAAAHAELAAHALGFGACWAGYFMFACRHWEPLVQALGLPEGNQAHAALMLGRPRFKYASIPPRRQPLVGWQ